MSRHLTEPCRDDSFRELERLYRDVAEITKRLDQVHSSRLQCSRGCSPCCVDDVTVFAIEARNIQHHNANILTQEAPHIVGACAFLDELGSCRIYNQRPYVCRTQGYPLRWLEDDEGTVAVEKRDICTLNDEGDAIESLHEKDCWSIGPFEERLAVLQHESDNGNMRRIRLRDLFRKAGL